MRGTTDADKSAELAAIPLFWAGAIWFIYELAQSVRTTGLAIMPVTFTCLFFTVRHQLAMTFLVYADATLLSFRRHRRWPVIITALLHFVYFLLCSIIAKTATSDVDVSARLTIALLALDTAFWVWIGVRRHELQFWEQGQSIFEGKGKRYLVAITLVVNVGASLFLLQSFDANIAQFNDPTTTPSWSVYSLLTVVFAVVVQGVVIGSIGLSQYKDRTWRFFQSVVHSY